jgi:hypothetical protein
MRLLSTLASLLAGVPYLGDLPYFHTGLADIDAGTHHLLPHSHSHSHSHHAGARPLVSHRLRGRLESMRERWAMKGFVVAVVASPEYTGDGWASEVLPFGQADHRGNPVTEDVRAARELICSLPACLPSPPTRLPSDPSTAINRTTVTRPFSTSLGVSPDLTRPYSRSHLASFAVLLQGGAPR